MLNVQILEEHFKEINFSKHLLINYLWKQTQSSTLKIDWWILQLW